MKTMKNSFSFTEIEREKGKILIFKVIFLNKHTSITNSDIILKFGMSVLHILPVGRTIFSIQCILIPTDTTQTNTSYQPY